MIERELSKQLIRKLSDKKIILILGPRQSGKSTLVEMLKSKFNQPVEYWNGDEADIRSMLEHPTSTRLKSIIGKNKTIIIDEAQRIQNIGLCLKLLADNFKGIKIIATGSSAFELANKINEPLTGRKWEFNLYPISFGEMVKQTTLLEEKRMLEHRLIYGYYPDVINSPGQEKEIIRQLTNSYLFKDILTWERIHKPDKLEKLVQALAFQMAQLISYNELGQICGMNNETVARYIDLLEKAFIVFRLPSWSRNPRNELRKSFKIFFYDNGLRNAVINQFNPVNLRQDIGQLWENFFISERLKFISNNGVDVNRFFWRSLAQQEVDYLEEANGKLIAFECKWNPKSKTKISRAFTEHYPKAMTYIVDSENFIEFLLEK